MNKGDVFRYIDAYVDNELDVKDALEVQGWIERDASCRAEYERVAALKRALFGNLGGPAPPAPELLKKRIQKTLRSERVRQIPWLRPALAAAAALVLVVFGVNFYQRALSVPQAMVADTMMIYRVEVGNPLEVQSGDIRRVAGWLQQNFQQEIRPIAFEGSQATILGARLCPFGGQKGAFVRYRRSDDRDMALFIGRSDGMPYKLPMFPSLRVKGQDIYLAKSGGFRLVFWEKGVWFYALVLEGEMDKEGVRKMLGQGSFVLARQSSEAIF
ncbi:MAG: hypothetical protein O2807_13815 [bacterium]|nr:hypothetical protein [bacterium]